MYLDSLDNRRYEKLTPNYNFDLLIIEQLYTAGLVTHFPHQGHFPCKKNDPVLWNSIVSKDVISLSFQFW